MEGVMQIGNLPEFRIRSQKIVCSLINIIMSDTSPTVNKLDRTDGDIKEAVKLWLKDAKAAKLKYGHITRWITTLVTDMSGLFEEAYCFNEDISEWDTSNVTTMARMFKKTYSFCQFGIVVWNTAKVTDMHQMFQEARAFDVDISEWNTRAVTNWEDMFTECQVDFVETWEIRNQMLAESRPAAPASPPPLPPSGKEQEKLKRTDADIRRAVSLWLSDPKQCENTYGHISHWNTSCVTDMSALFYGAISFNEDLSEWDTSSVVDMDICFYSAKEFCGDIGCWDVLAVQSMTRMFHDCPVSFIDVWEERKLDPAWIQRWQMRRDLKEATKSDEDVFIQEMRDHVFDTHTTYGNVSKLSRGSVVTKHMELLRKQLTDSLYWASSFYLRMAEDNIGDFNFIVAGTEATPYQNGLFLFKMTLPANYPDTSPACKLLSTHGGKIRMNPNLYACGKVCLSLLGTWSGPGWEKDNSNLCQVLLALQAQVMHNKPLTNEPGYEKSKKESIEFYNMLIRCNTMQTGILDTLAHPPVGFESMCNAYFSGQKRLEIARQVVSWAQDAKNYDPYKKYPVKDKYKPIPVLTMPAPARAPAPGVEGTSSDGVKASSSSSSLSVPAPTLSSSSSAAAPTLFAAWPSSIAIPVKDEAAEAAEAAAIIEAAKHAAAVTAAESGAKVLPDSYSYGLHTSAVNAYMKKGGDVKTAIENCTTSLAEAVLKAMDMESYIPLLREKTTLSK